MNYNISKYIIAQPINNEEILLYSTLSTSILTLEKQMYSDIFNDNSTFAAQNRQVHLNIIGQTRKPLL